MTKSKIFLLLLLSFIGGVFLCSIYSAPANGGGGIFVIGIFISGIIITLFALIQKNKNKLLLGICVLFLALGFWRSFEVFSYRGKSVEQTGEKIIFSGKIIEEPDRRSNFSQYILESETLGRVLIKTNLYPEYFYGDILKLKGKTETPVRQLADSGFDYQNYLAKDNIFIVSKYPVITLVERPANKDFYGHLLGIKKSFINTVNKIIFEPQASFLAALLVGAKRTLPPDLVDAFNRTGTSHIVAISGYNISIVSIMLFNFLGYMLLPRRLIFWLVGIGLIMFTLIAGAGASVVRAAIMGGLLILARREGRNYRITNAIIFAGAAMLFFNPYLLRYDASFQLSFLATLGLVYLAPHFNKWFSRLPNFLSFRTNLAATLSAQVMTLPVILFGFGRFSLIAILANVLILPVIPLTMLFGFLAGLIGFISLKIAAIFILPAWFMLSYQIWVVKILSLLPFASISL